MRVDLVLDQHQLEWEALLERVRFAEDAGFVGAWVFDHFKPLYGPAGGPCLEAWTLLAALAASTSTIRLGPLVTGVTYRHPSVLAAEVVTVDHASGGRVELGIGAAWFAEEHEELGIPFPRPAERIGRLDEALRVIVALMTEEDVDFEGRYYQLRGATYRPLPVQRPHPPIWIGGGGERKLLPLAARRADVWHGFGPVDELARKSRRLDQLAEEAGRDPATLGRSTHLSLSHPWDEVRRTAEALHAAGFGTLTASWPSEGQACVDEFVDKVLPELRELD
jgi:F420-dependent oxidoreductase-like protein